MAAVVLSGCQVAVTTSNPTDDGVLLNPTPWPNGTVGRYGLRIDPTLLAILPAEVGGNPIVEAADLELIDLDNSDLAASFDGIAEGRIGDISAANWLRVSVGRPNSAGQAADFYSSWVDQYDQSACSQADGVASVQQQSIADWDVDVATCKGGVVAYILQLPSGLIVSAEDLGPRRLGHQLMAALQ